MKKHRLKTKSEPMITLINIVFLILIFFLVSGTLYQPDDADLKFVQTHGFDCCITPDALSITKTGDLLFHGKPISSVSSYIQQLDSPLMVASVLPDRQLPAVKLLALIKQLRTGGAKKVIVVTEEKTQ